MRDVVNECPFMSFDPLFHIPNTNELRYVLLLGVLVPANIRTCCRKENETGTFAKGLPL